MMKSILNQLDRDAMLVMYVADELSAEDRRRAEQMIAGDGAVRAQAEELRRIQASIENGLAEVDASLALPVEARVAERHVGRMIRQWQSGRVFVPRNESVFIKGLKFPWWTYPLTAAASIVLAVLVWWGNTPLHSYNSPVAQGPTTISEPSTDAPSDDAQLADGLEQSFRHPSHEGISRAEGELYALSSATAADDALPDDASQQDVNQ